MATSMRRVSRRQCFGGGGSCDPEGAFLQVAPTPNRAPGSPLDLGETLAPVEKATLNQTTGALSDETDWTTVTPPGNGNPPLFVAPNVYLEWSGSTLYLTQDNGGPPGPRSALFQLAFPC